MTVREYIGARYVPLFMGEWSDENTYEPLSIVTNQGNSYTSRQSVPIGIPITSTEYWALTGNYNAQIEQYRQEVRSLENLLPATSFSSENTVEDAIEAVDDKLGASFSSENTVEDAIEAITPPSKLVVIGDSFTAPYGVAGVMPWCNSFASGIGLELVNLAWGGTGFVREQDGKTFLTQAQDAVSTLTQDEVSMIIIYGGINDYTSGYAVSTAAQNANSMASILRTAFPDAKLYFCFGNNGKNTSSSYRQWTNAMLQSVAGNWSVVDSSNWLQFYDYYQADDVHPTATGQAIICQQMMNVVNGGATDIKLDFLGTAGANVTFSDWNCKISTEQSICNVNASFTLQNIVGGELRLIRSWDRNTFFVAMNGPVTNPAGDVVGIYSLANQSLYIVISADKVSVAGGTLNINITANVI